MTLHSNGVSVFDFFVVVDNLHFDISFYKSPVFYNIGKIFDNMSLQLHLLQNSLSHLKLIVYVTSVIQMKAQKYYNLLSMNFNGKRSFSMKKNQSKAYEFFTIS